MHEFAKQENKKAYPVIVFFAKSNRLIFLLTFLQSQIQMILKTKKKST